MNRLFTQWSSEIKRHKKRIAISILFLFIAFILYAGSGDYVTDNQGSVVSPDLILDHFGPYDLSILYVWLFVAVISTFFIYPIIWKPHELAYVINMFSFFLIIRSGFIVFTHLRVPYDAVIVVFPGFLQILNFSNDLFFSGRAGLPFLGFLIFKASHKWLAYFMLISSIILGITVLLMHVHYSIDVLSAFFITYTLYHIGNKFIKKESFIPPTRI